MHKTKYNNTERIQGTDGVRGKSALASQAGLEGLSPVEAFLEKGVITEEFVELYAYSWAKLSGPAMEAGARGEFIVARDPRDKGGVFLRAACNGIRKAGFKAVDIGILPTPAVAIYITKRGSTGGFSITASHNPEDENGVKIFTGGPAIKLLPREEIDLTKELLAANWEKTKEMPISGGYEDAFEDARKTFIDFHIDPLNLRIKKGAPLRGGVFVLDAANGSLSACLSEVFGALGAERLDLVNCDLEGEVNKGGGTEAFAGLSCIRRQDIFSSGAPLGDCPMAKLLFEGGRRLEKKLIRGELALCGLAFDADGDRCLRIDYDPFCDQLKVHSGDEMAFHVARFGLDRYGHKMGAAAIIASIESDMGAADAARRMGVDTIFTPVGDKWLLTEAWASFFKWALDIWQKSAGKRRRSEAAGLAGEIELLGSQRLASSSSFSRIYKKITGLGGGPDWVEGIICESLLTGALPFAAACEPSGHLLLFSSIETASGLRSPAIVGSGLAAALASCISTGLSEIASDPRLYYRNLASPFVNGVKISYYVTYVEKRALMRDSDGWIGLKEEIKKAWSELFPNGGPLVEIFWPQEKDMLYFEGGSGEEGPKAAIFTRRSGTEDAARITLKGVCGLEKELRAIGLKIYKYMALNMKRLNSEGVRAQIELLRVVGNEIGGLPGANIDEIKAAASACIKEKLIDRSGDSLALAELGRWFLRSVS